MPRILVVDDEPDTLDLLKCALQQEGHQVIMATSGREAIELVRRDVPDLLVLGAITPDLDSLQVCKMVREDPCLAGLPVLLLTARATIEDRLAAFDAGADDCLTRPFDLRELLARVKALLHRSQWPAAQVEMQPRTSSPHLTLPPPVDGGDEPPFQLQIYALGPARVLRDGQPITNAQWESATSKEMFFLLLEHPQGLRKDQILEIFWQDKSLQRADSNFHSTLHRLRRALSKNSVLHEDGWYRLNPRLKYEYDVQAFEHELNRSAEFEGEPQRAAECLRRAINLYKGDFLEEFFSDWPFLRREALRNRYLSALLALGDLLVKEGEYLQAIELYQQALARDPYQEDALQKIRDCYIRVGNHSMARDYHQRWRKLRKAELDYSSAE